MFTLERERMGVKFVDMLAAMTSVVRYPSKVGFLWVCCVQRRDSVRRSVRVGLVWMGGIDAAFTTGSVPTDSENSDEDDSKRRF